MKPVQISQLSQMFLFGGNVIEIVGKPDITRFYVCQIAKTKGIQLADRPYVACNNPFSTIPGMITLVYYDPKKQKKVFAEKWNIFVLQATFSKYIWLITRPSNMSLPKNMQNSIMVSVRISPDLVETEHDAYFNVSIKMESQIFSGRAISRKI